MVQVMTNAQREQQNADDVQAAEQKAAEEMARKAAEEESEDNTVLEEDSSEEQGEWNDLLDDSDEDLEDSVTDDVDETDVVADDAPAEKEEEEKPQEPQPEETPKPTEEEPEVEVEEPTPPEDTRTPDEVMQAVTKARETAKEKLVEQFKMTEEQVAEFELDPSKVLAEMAATLYLDIFDSLMAGVRGQMPVMIQGVMSEQRNVAAAKKQFFTAWPQLNKPEYMDTINRIARVYRQNNPQSSGDTAVKEIGAQAWVALRLPLDELVKMTQGEVQQQSTAPIVTPQAHIPASGGNTPVQSRRPPQQQTNVFGQLADEFLDEDDL